MITSIIYGLFLGFFKFLFTFLPYASYPSELNAVLQIIGNSIRLINAIIPVSDVLTILGYVFIIETSILTFNIINFIYNKFRGSGG